MINIEGEKPFDNVQERIDIPMWEEGRKTDQLGKRNPIEDILNIMSTKITQFNQEIEEALVMIFNFIRNREEIPIQDEIL